MWTNEYQPEKPSFQVLLSVYNAEDYLLRCLQSLDRALSSYNWILLYADDGCTDDSTVELTRYARTLTCDKVHLYEFDKASTVGEAKNRLVKECHSYKDKYPYILFMDADDEMLPERPRMAETAQRENNQYVVGSYETIKINGERVKHNSENVAQKLSYGPWATLFHADFLPEEDPFFPEDLTSDSGHEDVLTWYHLKYIKNTSPVAHPPENLVHSYIQRKGSVSFLEDQTKRDIKRNTFWGISDLIKNSNRDIYKNPLSREEGVEAMNNYVNEKQKKPNEHPFS
jgi:glycosyltransferase involved in cell wall biosynthesis